MTHEETQQFATEKPWCGRFVKDRKMGHIIYGTSQADIQQQAKALGGSLWWENQTRKYLGLNR